MALLEIITLPNPILRKKAHKVTDFGKEFRTLVADMVETMRNAPGVGLAAPQVAVPLRLIVVEYGDDEDENMPKTPWGESVEIILNPIGVLGRMNIGQLYELYCGLISKDMAIKVSNAKSRQQILYLFKTVLTLLDNTKNKEYSNIVSTKKYILAGVTFTFIFVLAINDNIVNITFQVRIFPV